MNRLRLIVFVLFLLAGCAGNSGTRLLILDVEKAMADTREFDLGDISTEVRFIPLDDSMLVGDINKLVVLDVGFHILEYGSQPIKYSITGADS